MYGTTAISHRALDDLAAAAGASAIDELRALSRPIEGLRILNLSVSAFGNSTAELLNSSVPLLTDLGLDCHWQVVRASEENMHANRAMYQALGGTHIEWTREMTDAWQRYAEMNAGLLTEPFDVIIVHDPQPAAIRSYVQEDAGAKWVLHSHLDLSSAQEEVWLPLRAHVEGYDAAIFEAESFARHDLTMRTYIVPPAIDPNSPRNMDLPDDVVRTVLERYGLNPDAPIITQISPLDAKSDLTGAVDVTCALRDRFPGLQLLLVLMTEPQDAAGRAAYDELARRCADEHSVFIVSVGNDVGNVEINVFQRAASVVMQKGLRKGYGLWVSDALWKERPAVVAPAPGLLEQVIDGETGLVAHDTAGFVDAVGKLLADPRSAAKLGRNGRARVADKFLITRYLRDYLKILNELHRSRA